MRNSKRHGRIAVRLVAAWLSLTLAGIGQARSQDLARVPTVPTNGAELLALYGIDASHFERFEDGRSLGPAEEETLVRILYHFPRFSLEWLERWSRRDQVELAKLAESNGPRAAVVSLRGRVKRIEKTELIPEVAQRMEFKHYYRATIELAESPYTAVVAVRTIPANWENHSSLDEPVTATALFLKAGEASGERPELVFAANRLAWHPDRVSEPFGITSDHVLLAELGVDIGLLFEERKYNRKPIVAGDREGFYQLLSKLKNASTEKFAARATKQMNLAVVLQTPRDHHGDIVRVTGHARRVTKIIVEEEDIRFRYGLQHYFQIDMFVPLNNQVIRFGKESEEREPLVFENTFPVTVCVPTVPPLLEQESNLPVEVSVPATFFKLWSYRSDYASQVNKDTAQVSPMLIGIHPQIVPPEKIDPQLGVWLLVIIGLTLSSVWIGLKWYGRRQSDATPFERMRAKVVSQEGGEPNGEN